MGTIDLLKIVSCSIKSEANEREPTFLVETVKDKSLTGGPFSDYNRYEIIATNFEECKIYVNALNYLSQLVKCKAYAFKGNSKIKK